jgi:hypothetical protein
MYMLEEKPYSYFLHNIYGNILKNVHFFDIHQYPVERFVLICNYHPNTWISWYGVLYPVTIVTLLYHGQCLVYPCSQIRTHITLLLLYQWVSYLQWYPAWYRGCRFFEVWKENVCWHLISNCSSVRSDTTIELDIPLYATLP